MRVAVRLLNAGLLLAAWLLAVLGAWASLVTGQHPALASAILLGWTALVVATGRVALARPSPWRWLLPGLVLALSLAAFDYGLRFVRQRGQEQGMPRRYYSWDAKK